MLKKILFAALLTAASSATAAGRTVTVVDSADCSPLPAASVFDADGIMLGMTDADGRFDLPRAATVRCLGYMPAAARGCGDTLRMSPLPYELDELAVRPADRDVMRMICYVREYTGLGTDSLSVAGYADYMVDYMLPLRKLKKFKGHSSPRVLKTRNILKVKKLGRPDSISANSDISELSWLSIAEMPEFKDKNGQPLMLPEKLRGQCGTDTLPGKYGIKMVYRTTPERVTIVQDALADAKDHTVSPWLFKLFGLTIDLNEINSVTAFTPNDGYELRPEDMLMRTYTMEALGRGKWIKKLFQSKDPVRMRSYFEIYPVEYTYLFVDEARELKENPPVYDAFTIPDTAMPLDSATLEMIEKAEGKF